MYFDHISLPLISNSSQIHPLPPNPFLILQLFYSLVANSASPICADHVYSGRGATQWSVIDLQGVTLLKRLLSLSQKPLASITLQPGVGTHETLPLQSRIAAGLTVRRSCSGNSSCRDEFTTTGVLSCSEDTVSLWSSLPFGSGYLSTPSSQKGMGEQCNCPICD